MISFIWQAKPNSLSLLVVNHKLLICLRKKMKQSNILLVCCTNRKIAVSIYASPHIFTGSIIASDGVKLQIPYASNGPSYTGSLSSLFLSLNPHTFACLIFFYSLECYVVFNALANNLSIFLGSPVSIVERGIPADMKQIVIINIMCYNNLCNLSMNWIW